MITAELNVPKQDKSYREISQNQREPFINQAESNTKNWSRIKPVLEKIISDAALRNDGVGKDEDLGGETGDNVEVYADGKTEEKTQVTSSATQGEREFFFGDDGIRELTLGYVRVRELQRDIERAKKILAKMAASKVCEEKQAAIESMKQTAKLMFDQRAEKALAHATWRAIKFEEKLNGCRELGRLKSQVDLVERKHYHLRRQLMSLQSYELPKKNRFFSRLFASFCIK